MSHLAPLVNLLSKHDVDMGKKSHVPPVMCVLLSGVLMVVFLKNPKYLQEDTEEDSFVQSQIFSSTWRCFFKIGNNKYSGVSTAVCK